MGLREGCLDNAYRGFGFFQTPGQQGVDGVDLVIVNHFEHTRVRQFEGQVIDLYGVR